ncbi:hypothetical protein BJ508DRAFT_323833 [Ascobolus immersus RN42]|uniref:Uncharacterized protein n=1 Tax=Ascobolus immersus RN42 TaxID=1160509 RepID=A0A3N4IJ48_ASCIM|nr:hypothetical protein BJ508DRAFT_323833 [Ascobolus immersus RN42]
MDNKSPETPPPASPASMLSINLDNTDPSHAYIPPASEPSTSTPRRLHTVFCLHNEYCTASSWKDPAELKITTYNFPHHHREEKSIYRLMKELGKAGHDGRACLDEFVKQREEVEGKRLAIACLSVHTKMQKVNERGVEQLVARPQTLFVELEEMGVEGVGS